MQIGSVLLDSLGPLAFVALCVGLALRKPASPLDLKQLEEQAREEEARQARGHREWRRG